MQTKTCGFCQKVFQGYTEKQVSYLYKQHVLSKHPEFLEIKD